MHELEPYVATRIQVACQVELDLPNLKLDPFVATVLHKAAKIIEAGGWVRGYIDLSHDREGALTSPYDPDAVAWTMRGAIHAIAWEFHCSPINACEAMSQFLGCDLRQWNATRPAGAAGPAPGGRGIERGRRRQSLASSEQARPERHPPTVEPPGHRDRAVAEVSHDPVSALNDFGDRCFGVGPLFHAPNPESESSTRERVSDRKEKPMLIYAGIGARQTPAATLRDMTIMAAWAARTGWHLATGGASGADSAFAQGAPTSKRTIYLPWRGFGGQCDPDCRVLAATQMERCMDIVRRLHPAWHRCSPGAQKLHARNAAVLLGCNLDRPIDAVVCWTPGGAVVGGTGMALRIAARAADPDPEPRGGNTQGGLRAPRRHPPPTDLIVPPTRRHGDRLAEPVRTHGEPE